MLTTRETIVDKLMATLADETSVVRILRGNSSTMEVEFKGLADNDFPILVVQVGLPQPNIKYSSRSQGVIDEVRSTLNIDIFCYIRCVDGVEGDEVSILLNDIWKVICDNPTLGGAIKIVPSISQALTYNGPYIYFTITLGLEYVHTNKI